MAVGIHRGAREGRDEPAAGGRSVLAALVAAGCALAVARAMDRALEQPLRQASAAIATAVLHWIGLGATRDGTTIATTWGRFDVLLPCSGGRMLAATLAIASACAVLGRAPLVRRLWVLVLSPGLALMANATRVVLLVLGGVGAPPAVHTALGLGCFGAAVLVLRLLTGAGRGNPA